MQYVTNEELRDLRLQARYTIERAAALCGVNIKTWTRWEAGAHRIPLSVYRLIQIIGLGELPPSADHAWTGWRFINGKLWDPLDNHWYTPGSIRAWFWVSQQLDERQRRENLQQHQAGDNVIALPTARPGHAVRTELYKRLEDD